MTTKSFLPIDIIITKTYLRPPKTPPFLTVYTESAARGESPGWSDWSEECKPYYKFKYTIASAGERIVVIISRSAFSQHYKDFDDFKEIVSNSAWFKLFKVYATTYGSVELKYPFSKHQLNKLSKLFTNYELLQEGLGIKLFLADVEKLIVSPEPKYIIALGDEYIHFRISKSFVFDVLPFKLEAHIIMPTEYFYNKLRLNITHRDLLRLAVEVVRPAKYIDLSNYKLNKPVDRAAAALARMQKMLVNKYQIDITEKFKAWLYYHKHFRVTMPID